MKVFALIIILAYATFCLANFHEASLKETNRLRAKHGAPPLKRDPVLDKFAQAYAEKLAESNKFEHNPDEKYGENLSAYWGPQKTNEQAAVDAVNNWYNEVQNYDFSKPDFGMKTGHFTQLVWKETERQGIGVATNPKTKYTVVVANYEPAGNMMGEFEQNVGKLIE